MPITDAQVESLQPAQSTTRKTLVRALINSTIGVGAFILTCIAVRAVLPFPEIDQVSPKLRFFAAHKDEFDTLFIGSSRIYHQVSPAIFDRVMRENGRPTRSFNFGVDGMHLPESAYFLEQVLSTKPRNLRWVFVEFDELQTNWFFQGEGNRRALYWHDWKRTSLVLRRILNAGTNLFWLPTPKKLRDIVFHRKGDANTQELLVFHASQFEKNFTNLGRASDITGRFSRPHKIGPALIWLGPAGDGYLPIDKKMSAAETQDYEQTLAQALKQVGPKPVSPYTEKACRQCSEKIRRLGAVPVFLVTPTAAVQSKFTFRSDPLGTVISFNDARAYPNLYRSSARIDHAHVNKTAAEEFTRLVAAKFAQLVNAGNIQ